MTSIRSKNFASIIVVLFIFPSLLFAQNKNLSANLKEIEAYAAKAGQDWRDSAVYPFPKGFVTFTLDAHAKVGELKLDVPNADFDFTELEFKRMPEANER